MTVKELINKLQTLDQEMTVLMSTDGAEYIDINEDLVDMVSFGPECNPITGETISEDFYNFVTIISKGVDFNDETLFGSKSSDDNNS